MQGFVAFADAIYLTTYQPIWLVLIRLRNQAFPLISLSRQIY